MKYVININNGESSRFKEGEEFRLLILNPTNDYDIIQMYRSIQEAELRWFKEQLDRLLLFKKNKLHQDLVIKIKDLMKYKRLLLSVDITNTSSSKFPDTPEDIVSDELFGYEVNKLEEEKQRVVEEEKQKQIVEEEEEQVLVEENQKQEEHESITNSLPSYDESIILTKLKERLDEENTKETMEEDKNGSIEDTI